MSWLDKIMGAKTKHQETKQEDVSKAIAAKLKSLVYDDELVTELLPVFVKLHNTEGFDKVVQLLETKEQQIEAISGGQWFKQESDPDTQAPQDEPEQSSGDLVAAILSKRHGE